MYLCHDSFICVTWLIHTCDMTRDAFMCVRCRAKAEFQDIQYELWKHVSVPVTYNMNHGIWVWGRTCVCVWHDSSICVIWIIHMCYMTHLYVWRDSPICVRDMMQHELCNIHLCHNSFTYVTWLIHMCDMTCSPVWHDSFKCVTWCIHVCYMTHSCVPHVIHICNMTHWYLCHDTLTYVCHDAFICVARLIYM